jgi:hypothetical protein
VIEPAKPPVRAPARTAKTPASQAVAAQQAQFDRVMEERAELEREANVLRDMMLAQLKADDEALKKYIAMI